MVASVVRGIGSVLTVLVAILVTTRAGETATAKVVAAAFSAAVLIALEWFVRWSPRHLQWARRHLDERSVWTGVWVQTVTDAWSATGREDDNQNNFSVFRVLYGADTGYVLVGRAYADDGTEVAEWESTEGATFSRDGRRLSYTWQGKTREPGGGVDPERTGLATMKLRPGESNNGTGDVQHVGINRQLDVEFERVAAAMLRSTGLDQAFTLPALDGDGERRRFAVAFAQARTAGQFLDDDLDLEPLGVLEVERRVLLARRRAGSGRRTARASRATTTPHASGRGWRGRRHVTARWLTPGRSRSCGSSTWSGERSRNR